MTDDNVQLALTENFRSRWQACLKALKSATRKFDESDYNRVFWQSPCDWPELAPEQNTLADMLFQPKETPEHTQKNTGDYPCVFAEFLDGAFSVRSKPCADYPWKKFEDTAFVPFIKRNYDRERQKYTDHRDSEAIWILMGAGEDDDYLPRTSAAQYVYPRCHPIALAGVAIHADLTWDRLEIQMSTETGIRRLVLPDWGLWAFLQRTNPLLAETGNREKIQSLLSNISQTIRVDEESTHTLLPKDLQMDRYLNRLRHLSPHMPEPS